METGKLNLDMRNLLPEMKVWKINEDNSYEYFFEKLCSFFWMLNSGLSIEFNEIHNLIRKDVALQESEKNRRKLLMILK